MGIRKYLLASFLLSVCTSCYTPSDSDYYTAPVTASPPPLSWQFESSIDEMTHEKSCRLSIFLPYTDSYQHTNGLVLAYSETSDGKAMIILSADIYPGREGYLKVGNGTVHRSVKNLKENLIFYAPNITSEFLSSNDLMIRFFEWPTETKFTRTLTLNGFKEGYSKWKDCEKNNRKAH